MKKKIIWALVFVLLLGLGFLGFVAATFKIPEFAGMDGIDMQDMEHGKLHAVISAKIWNANFFALGARKVDYEVSYHDTIIGRGELPEGLSLKASDTTLLELPVDMDINGIFAVHRSMLKQDRCALDVHLNGEFTFVRFQQSLDLQVDVEPKKFIQQVLGKSLGKGGIRMEEMRWIPSSIDESGLEFVTLIQNPLSIPLDLQSLNIKLFTENKQRLAGEWQLSKPISLQPQQDTRMPGRMTLRHLAATLSVIGNLFSGEMKFDAQGKMIVEMGKFPFEIPIQGKVVVDARTAQGRWE